MVKYGVYFETQPAASIESVVRWAYNESLFSYEGESLPD